MGKKTTYYSQALHILQELKKQYPGHTLGQHISTALGEQDLWNTTDKDFLYALEKYKVELEFNIASDNEVDRIMKEAQNLDKLFQEEEEDYD